MKTVKPPYIFDITQRFYRAVANSVLPERQAIWQYGYPNAIGYQA
ncbi:hypothetical protein PN498_16130 [Oscillatoria sp. CS-180]|nr:hypothetical protein [Oscillatoria sp. CS-180]MDB9527527.1 hypothetical protein [Oscillatoria sp. CS-180]